MLLDVPFGHVNAVYGLTKMFAASSSMISISVELYSHPDWQLFQNLKVGYQFLFRRTRRETSVGGFFTTM